MSCASAAATTSSTASTTSTCNPTKFINSTFSLHSNSIRHFVKVPRCGLFKKKHAMRIPKRSIASCFSSLFSPPFELNFSLFHSPHSFLDYPRCFTHFATRKRPFCACGEGLFFLLKFDFLLYFFTLSCLKFEFLLLF